jgi:hypothetical protein
VDSISPEEESNNGKITENASGNELPEDTIVDQFDDVWTGNIPVSLVATQYKLSEPVITSDYRTCSLVRNVGIFPI